MSTNIQSNNGSLKIFCAYAHKDEQLRNELEKHLKVLQREGLIDVWHDRRIVPGIEWDKEIQKELAKADIILLLISSDFIFSDYAYDREMQTAVERHEKGNAIVIPVLLRPVDWGSTPFSKIQALPRDAKPITMWENQDEAFLNVVTGLRNVISNIKSQDKLKGYLKNSFPDKLDANIFEPKPDVSDDGFDRSKSNSRVKIFSTFFLIGLAALFFYIIRFVPF